MINIAVKAVKDLEKMGASEGESYILSSTECVISVRNNIWNKRKKKDVCIGLRTLTDKKKGFAAGTLPMCSLEEIEKASLALSKASAPDPYWKHLPHKKKVTEPEGIFDKNLKDMSELELLDTVQILVDTAGDRACQPDCTVITRVEDIALANSHGVEGFYSSTKIDVTFSCRCKENDILSEFHSRNFSDNLYSLAENTVKNALESKKFSKVDKTFTGDIVLLPEAAGFIVMPCIKWAVDGENFYSKRSHFTLEGEEVASPLITITDNGLLPSGVQSAPFDGEGTPMQKTVLLEKGIFRHVLHSEYTACKYGSSSTGNALRSATREPSVSPTNLVIKKGRSSLTDLIEQVDTGVLLNDFTGDVDPSSGYFNGRGEGSYIKGGEIEYSCKNLHVQGNAFELLGNVTGVGKEEHCSSEGVYAVPLLTGTVTVIA